jgi:hypothetical protein
VNKNIVNHDERHAGWIEAALHPHDTIQVHESDTTQRLANFGFLADADALMDASPPCAGPFLYTVVPSGNEVGKPRA